jgi:hypothetical protein
MNGWNPVHPRECETLEEVIETNGGQVSPVLSISRFKDGGRAFGETILSQSVRGTEFYVHIGASRDEVLKDLAAINEYVTLYFDLAITDEKAANEAADRGIPSGVAELDKMLANAAAA